MEATNPEVAVHATGPVSKAERAYASRKIAALLRIAPGPVLFAKADLVSETDPARERPAIVKAELDVNGRLVRAHIAAATMFVAVDLVEARLRHRLERREPHCAGSPRARLRRHHQADRTPSHTADPRTEWP